MGKAEAEERPNLKLTAAARDARTASADRSAEVEAVRSAASLNRAGVIIGLLIMDVNSCYLKSEESRTDGATACY